MVRNQLPGLLHACDSTSKSGNKYLRKRKVAGHTHVHAHVHIQCTWYVHGHTEKRFSAMLINSPKRSRGVSSSTTRLDPLGQNWLLLIGDVLSLLHAGKGRWRPRRGNEKARWDFITAICFFVRVFTSNLWSIILGHTTDIFYFDYVWLLLSKLHSCIFIFLCNCTSNFFFQYESRHTCQIEMKTRRFRLIRHFVAGELKFDACLMIMWFLVG